MFAVFSTNVATSFLISDFYNQKSNVLIREKDQVKNLIIEHGAELSKGKINEFKSSLSKGNA